MSYNISINNKKVYDFYTIHKNISFEDMSCLMVDVLKKILKKPDTSLDTTLAEKILLSMNTIDSKITNMDNLFENKFTEFKKSYTEELNNIIKQGLDEKTTTLLKEYNENMQDKTKVFFNEFFPKNNELNLNTTFNFFDKLINSSESRLQSSLNETKNNLESKLMDIGTINNTQNVISENINTLIKKFHGSSTKGNFSEVSVVEGLTRIYPYGNIEHVGNKLSNSGDIILTRKDKNKIIIENKEYDYTVHTAEIQKFIDNVVLNKCDGIMISQQTQITNKDDFEININGDLVLVYICNMGYNMDKVRTAISIIDHLKSQIAFINKDKTSVSLTLAEVESINKEYNIFLNQKKYILKMFHNSYTKITKEIENIKVPSIEYILMREYGVKLCDEEDCKWCGKPCKNAAGISAHLKSCEEYLQSEQYKMDQEIKENETETKKGKKDKKPKKDKKGILDII